MTQMGHRLSKIYTKTGDDGSTGLSDGSRIDKSTLRIGTIGDVDELNSMLGVLLTEQLPDEIADHLKTIQHSLFDLGGELSIPGSVLLEPSYVEMLEQLIDSYNKNLPPLKEFILPGGNKPASVCHLARTICRRAERQLVALQKSSDDINKSSLSYLNRLSDLLFVFARVLARQNGGSEVYWQKDRLK